MQSNLKHVEEDKNDSKIVNTITYVLYDDLMQTWGL